MNEDTTGDFLPEIIQFLEDFTEEMISGNAAYFIGAGISKPSNLPDWSSLLAPHANKIGIKDLAAANLPLVAQYVINEESGNRGPFINSISKKLRRSFSPNAYHELIAKTNIKTIWTTNYDNLIEKAFASHIQDVKFSDDSVSRDLPNSQIEIIKMHGCIYNSHRDEIVITQSDYEDFFINRPALSQRLRLDLIQKSFLFIGYGYNDVNIGNIVSEARRLAGRNTRQHYMICKDEPENSAFPFWCSNLRRYGIRVVRIQNFSQLTEILRILSLKSRGKSIFVSGSHILDHGFEIEEISRQLAEIDDIALNDGQSTGPMRTAAKIFTEAIISKQIELGTRLRFFPNPYASNKKFSNDPSLLSVLKNWRLPLLKATQIMIAFDGGMGTKAEIEVALEVGCIVIPFFKDSRSSTWQFLEQPIVTDRLTYFDPTYVQKVKAQTATPADVIALVKQILS
ncbi:SIR2 family protein [Dyadobacter sp. OTU695]|uniref:SIR2 family protein n=1 Tax=Dyadobacter sp. OTU695 TaxID=3043860 RepID=UPI00313D3724